MNIEILEPNAWYMDPETGCPLASRGWIFQERHLSQRILYFGKYKLSWECATHERYENISIPVTPQIRNKSKADFRHPKELEELHQHWLHIVTTFTERARTRSMDRLPALSGIASEFQEKNGERYIAGLWRSHLLQGVLWLVYPSNRIPIEGEPYRAPTWSWASVDQPINYRFDSWEFVPDAEIISVECHASGQDPFGAVSPGANLSLRGRVKTAYVVRDSTHGDHDTNHDSYEGDRFYVWDVNMRRIMSRFFPDDYHFDSVTREGFSPLWSPLPDDVSLADGQDIRSQVVTEERELLLLFIGWFSPDLFPTVQCLAIKSVPGRTDTYARIGMVRTMHFALNQEWVEQVTDKRTLHLI